MASESVTNSQEKQMEDELLGYLESCKNNKDRHMFYKNDGSPDIDGARKWAEKMRKSLGDLLDELIIVEQRNNAVDVMINQEVMAENAY